MSLTQTQAQDQYIIDSLVWFLDRNVKQFYDPAVSGQNGSFSFSDPLKIMVGGPDDPSWELKVPTIAINTLESSERDEGLGMGTPEKYRHMNFVLYCYPDVTSTGMPSLQAMMVLRAKLRNALGGKYIAILDYSNPKFSATNMIRCGDVMEILKVLGPMPRGTKETVAKERHRFDMHISVCYPVVETMGL